MKKFKNITFGGIQQKIFNLVLIMLVLIMAAYSVMIVYQMKNLTGLVTETNDTQKGAITAISGYFFARKRAPRVPVICAMLSLPHSPPPCRKRISGLGPGTAGR